MNEIEFTTKLEQKPQSVDTSGGGKERSGNKVLDTLDDAIKAADEAGETEHSDALKQRRAEYARRAGVKEGGDSAPSQPKTQLGSITGASAPSAPSGYSPPSAPSAPRVDSFDERFKGGDY